jgi:GT2 family glycosyltransferase
MISCPKVLVTIPVYQSVEALPYMTHLLFSQQTGKAEAMGKYKVRFNVGGPGVRCPLVRNGGVEIALTGGGDFLFFVDDDMLIQPDILERLLEIDKPIATPIFFRSGGNNAPLVYDIDSSTGEPVNMTNYPVDQVFEAPGGCGTGVMLIKREVFEALDAPYFYYPQDTRYGMDLLFCRRAREKGFATYCDSRILVEQMDNPQPVGRRQWTERKLRNEQSKGSV